MNVKKKYLLPILLVCLTAGQIVSIYAEAYTSHLQVTATNTSLAAGSKSNINQSVMVETVTLPRLKHCLAPDPVSAINGPKSYQHN
jgi:hypothetical protein